MKVGRMVWTEKVCILETRHPAGAQGTVHVHCKIQVNEGIQTYHSRDLQDIILRKESRK